VLERGGAGREIELSFADVTDDAAHAIETRVLE
jgi:hypothetical protein